jgi:hypothetical protein
VWRPDHGVRAEVKRDGSLANGQVFVDMTGARGEDAIDGVKVDALSDAPADRGDQSLQDVRRDRESCRRVRR